MIVAALLLRIIGAFYVFGSIVGARMITRYAFIDHAIEAIGGNKQPSAERLREMLMLAGLLPVFAGGLALAFLSPWAPWLFALGVLWQALYLGWIAPRWLDPLDDPGEQGREKTWRAFYLYVACTALVLGGAFAGLLEGPHGPAAIAIGTAASAGFGAWAFRALLNPMGKRSGSVGTEAGHADDSGLSDSGFEIREPAGEAVIVRPSWNDGALFSQATGHPISHGWQEEYLSEQAIDLLNDVCALFRRFADPYDPRRCALIDPVDIDRIAEGAADALAIVRNELGAERVRFEPLPAPVDTELSARRIKIEPYHLNSTIWSLDEAPGEAPRPVYPDYFGISWSLARHLDQWALDWHEDQDDDAASPEEPPRWSEQRAQAHEEEGRVLAVRLARELAATGRGDVEVFHMTRRDGLRQARAGDPIPPLPPAERDV